MNKTRLNLLDSLPKGGICAELGVFAGDFSMEILARTNPKVLYLVDTFSGVVASGDQNGENMRRMDMGEQFQKLREFSRTRSDVEVVKAISWEWLDRQIAGYLDWLYLDTSHTFEATTMELGAALRAVKSGGFICGHDYSQQTPGVIAAVKAFAGVRKETTVELFEGDKLASFKIEVRK